ncbi:hypothetical protein [Desulfurispora thermophila]|nr:hypothetical protein [Desulfurispora thermophila]
MLVIITAWRRKLMALARLLVALAIIIVLFFQLAGILKQNFPVTGF